MAIVVKAAIAADSHATEADAATSAWLAGRSVAFVDHNVACSSAEAWVRAACMTTAASTVTAVETIEARCVDLMHRQETARASTAIVARHKVVSQNAADRVEALSRCVTASSRCTGNAATSRCSATSPAAAASGVRSVTVDNSRCNSLDVAFATMPCPAARSSATSVVARKAIPAAQVVLMHSAVDPAWNNAMKAHDVALVSSARRNAMAVHNAALVDQMPDNVTSPRAVTLDRSAMAIAADRKPNVIVVRNAASDSSARHEMVKVVDLKRAMVIARAPKHNAKVTGRVVANMVSSAADGHRLARCRTMAMTPKATMTAHAARANAANADLPNPSMKPDTNGSQPPCRRNSSNGRKTNASPGGHRAVLRVFFHLFDSRSESLHKPGPGATKRHQTSQVIPTNRNTNCRL